MVLPFWRKGTSWGVGQDAGSHKAGKPMAWQMYRQLRAQKKRHAGAWSRRRRRGTRHGLS